MPTVLLLWYVLPAMMVQRQTSILNILPNYQETICVGAHDQDGEQCYFSPESDQVDFLALGDNVIGPILKKTGKPWNEPKKGTFYAAPVIGGLICLVLEAVKKNLHVEIRSFNKYTTTVYTMKELMKKFATRKGVKNFECFFFLENWAPCTISKN